LEELQTTVQNTLQSQLSSARSRRLVSDVKRGQNLEAEAVATRPRPISGSWGQGQSRGQKQSWEKYQIMINNIRFKIIDGKINKIPEFYKIFAW